MTYVLYGDQRTGSSIVELALAEIGAAYEPRPVVLDREEQRQDSYAAVNPQRKVPTLITGTGETLTESAAILLTLDERHPEAGLLPPSGSQARAQALRWLLFLATELYPIVEIIDFPARFTAGPESGAETTRDRAREIWRARWLIFEQAIAGDPYLLTEGFCLTDLYAAVVSRWGQQEDWRPGHIPKVERLAAAVVARPKCQAVWDKHFGGR